MPGSGKKAEVAKRKAVKNDVNTKVGVKRKAEQETCEVTRSRGRVRSTRETVAPVRWSPGATSPKKKRSISNKRSVARKIEFKRDDNNNTNATVNKAPKAVPVLDGNEIAELDAHDGVLIAVDPGEELDYDDVLVPDDRTVQSTMEEWDEEPAMVQDEQRSNVDVSSEQQFNGCTVEQLLANPQLKLLLNRMVDERIQKDKSIVAGTSARKDVIEMGAVAVATTPKTANEHGKVAVINSTITNSKSKHRSSGTKAIPVVKSPSDTTIYAPALKQRTQHDDLVRKFRNDKNAWRDTQ